MSTPIKTWTAGEQVNAADLNSNFELVASITGMVNPYAGSSAPDGWLLCDGSAISRTTYSALFNIIGTTFGAGDGSTTFNVPNLKSSIPVGAGQKVVTFDFNDGDVSTGTDQITVSSNDYLHTGQAVDLSNSGGALPSGLSAQTYYIIRVDATTVKLATSVANANAGTAVDITGASGGGTHTLTLTMTDRSLGDDGGEEDHALTDAEMPSHTHSLDTLAKISGSAVQHIGTSNNVDTQDNTGSAGSDDPHNNMPPYVVLNYIIKV